MAEFISYDDNLFFVMAQVKHLNNGLKLTLHRSQFSQYYGKQFVFLSDLVHNIQDELMSRPQLIRLNDYLQMLRSTQSEMIKLLDTFMAQSILSCPEVSLMQLRDELQEAHAVILEHLAENEKIITQVDTVSSEEMSILLSVPEDSL
ncbi:MAG: hypothetical protein ACRCVN_06990 [Spirochaetia bacterium]